MARSTQYVIALLSETRDERGYSTLLHGGADINGTQITQGSVEATPRLSPIINQAGAEKSGRLRVWFGTDFGGGLRRATQVGP